jgi:cellobiose transport system permease protein
MAISFRTLGMRRSRRRLLRRAGPGTYVCLALVTAASIFPLYWSLVVASHDNSAIGAYPPVLLPGSNLWHNISKVFNPDVVNIDFWAALVNSVIVASTIAFAVVLTSAMAGFAFAKLRFRGNGVLMLVVVVTMMVPLQLGVIPLYIEMIRFHWLNNLKAVIVPYLVTAFGVFFMRQFIAQAVPNELIDAARVDGCHTARIFWHVVLPAVRPAAAVLGLLAFLEAWNNFFWPLIVLTPSNATVQVAVSTIASGNYIPDYSLILTATFVSVLPLLVIFLLVGRQIIGGIMSGAVKA